MTATAIIAFIVMSVIVLGMFVALLGLGRWW